MAVTEEMRKQLAAKIMMQGVPETDAERAASAILLFRAIRFCAFENTTVSDEAAATLAAGVINSSWSIRVA